jgi:kynurenine formamidase
MEMTEEEVLELFTTCSNHGRWGEDDERGTLNYVTPEKRLAAIASVRDGVSVPLAHPLVTRGSRQVPPSAVHVLTYSGYEPHSALELLSLSPHGFEMTHLDAVCHMFFEGGAYNGRRAADVLSRAGLTFGSITAAEDGIVTRGVLLDVARARGVEYLEAGDGIGVADLVAAEELAGVRVESGDVVFVRSGLRLRQEREGDLAPSPREGVLPETLPWFHERQIAVYSGDCIERQPSGYTRVKFPLHQIGLSAMGLSLMDSSDCEGLAEACAGHGRGHFLVVIAPLRVPGGSASPVNPLAIF